MDRAELSRWLDDYERAWRTPGTEPLDALFADDATYQAAPFEPPLRGRDAIAKLWESERVSADEAFTLTTDIVAVEGDVGVVRVEVHYADIPVRHYRDLWIVSLDSDGRCVAFEEWPFFPDQPHVA